MTDSRAPRHTISFWRTGPDPFEGEFYLRGDRFEDFKLTSPVVRIPQDAHNAAETAKALIESGAPDAYERAVEALGRVSTGVSW